MQTGPIAKGPPRRVLVLTLAGIVMVAVGVLAGLALAGTAAPTPRQEDVAARGAQVMPFDLDRTTHVFEKLSDGGLQTVRADDPGDAEQVQLIQAHLRAEAEKFRRGDFSDPAAIHGQEMPGLAELRAGAARITIAYTATTDGGQVRYTTADPELVAGLHRWFDAQLMDHGAHATEH